MSKFTNIEEDRKEKKLINIREKKLIVKELGIIKRWFLSSLEREKPLCLHSKQERKQIDKIIL